MTSDDSHNRKVSMGGYACTFVAVATPPTSSQANKSHIYGSTIVIPMTLLSNYESFSESFPGKYRRFESQMSHIYGYLDVYSYLS